ncbi:sulfatase [Lentisphaera profundi]|uniref:Sulfatase n=1 Tax=Lentisphaera profundi TaxID=1658616 RepID=A0ABY7VSF3_9BACT|nr:sulfatase [Lentisphaera profundi]WDE96977.1 sulfatase [Lentisphaera profundi]
MLFSKFSLVFLSSLALLADAPNILVITVDDLKPTLGCYGDEFAITPAIDAIAARGTLFNANYCQQAVCAPSRISMFTGLRPDTTGILDLHTSMRDINPNVITMPQYFKEKGYLSIGYGKIMHGAKNDDTELSWSERDEELPYNREIGKPVLDKFQNPKAQEILKRLSKKSKKLKTNLLMKELKKEGAYFVSEAYDLPDDAYKDGAVAKAGTKRLKELSETKEKFFMVLGFNKPHLPFNAPKKYWDMYDPNKLPLAEYRKQDKQRPKYAYHSFGELAAYKDYKIGEAVDDKRKRHLIHAYYACVSYVDAQIGKVMSELKASGLDKNTVVVLWGDHGWHLGDHGLWCKHSNFEQATKAPLIISAPNYPQGKVSQSSTEFIDIFPTLCKLSGLEVSEQLEGLDLSPILLDPKEKVKDIAVSQYLRWASHGYTMRSGQYRLTLWMPKDYYSFKKFDENQIQEIELYDYKKDPNEKTNFANNPEYKEILEKLKKQFAEHFAEQYDAEKAKAMPGLIKKYSRK